MRTVRASSFGSESARPPLITWSFVCRIMSARSASAAAAKILGRCVRPSKVASLPLQHPSAWAPVFIWLRPVVKGVPVTSQQESKRGVNVRRE